MADSGITPFSVPAPDNTVSAPTILYVSPNRQRPTWVVIWLMIFSLGLYWPVWFGQTWGELKRYSRDSGMRPFGHGLSLFVPIYGLFRVHAHYKYINEQTETGGVLPSVRPSTAVWGAILSGFPVIGLLIIGPMLAASGQQALNRLWQSAYGTASEKHASFGEWIMALALALLWIGAFAYSVTTDTRLPFECRGWSSYLVAHDRILTQEEEFWDDIQATNWTTGDYRELSEKAAALSQEYREIDAPPAAIAFVEAKAQAYTNYLNGFNLASQGQSVGAESWLESGDAFLEKADTALIAANTACAED